MPSSVLTADTCSRAASPVSGTSFFLADSLIAQSCHVALEFDEIAVVILPYFEKWLGKNV